MAQGKVRPERVRETRGQRRLGFVKGVVSLLTLSILLLLNTSDYWLKWVHPDEACTSKEQDISLPDQILFRYLLKQRDTGATTLPVVLTFGEADESDLLTNVCSGRSFTAKLIHVLNRRGVKVIALDKTYGDGSCSNEVQNQELVDAVVESRVPIVVGQGTEKVPEDVAKGDCLVKSPNLSFGTATVRRGITKLNADDLKIPLRWPVFESVAASQLHREASDTDGDSFAWAVAQAVDRTISSDKVVAANLARHSHPYGDFRGDIKPTPVRDVLCADPSSAEAYKQRNVSCEGFPPVDLSGRVVVVASESGADRHPFLKSEQPGAVLQAQYINALLNHRIYSDMPFWLCFWSLVGWILSLVYLLDFAKDNDSKRHRQKLWWLTGTFVVVALGLLIVPQIFDTVPPFSFVVAGFLPLAFELTAAGMNWAREDQGKKSGGA